MSCATLRQQYIAARAISRAKCTRPSHESIWYYLSFDAAEMMHTLRCYFHRKISQFEFYRLFLLVVSWDACLYWMRWLPAKTIMPLAITAYGWSSAKEISHTAEYCLMLLPFIAWYSLGLSLTSGQSIIIILRYFRAYFRASRIYIASLMQKIPDIGDKQHYHTVDAKTYYEV